MCVLFVLASLTIRMLGEEAKPLVRDVQPTSFLARVLCKDQLQLHQNYWSASSALALIWCLVPFLEHMSLRASYKWM